MAGDVDENFLRKMFAAWAKRWQFALAAVARRGGEPEPLEILPPAGREEIAEIERKLGHAIPVDFKKVLLVCASAVSFEWSYHGNFDGMVAEEAANRIIWGRCVWDVRRLVEINRELRGMVPEDVEEWDDYYCHWLGKFAFSETVNGDFLAIDSHDGSVWYLSHDGDDKVNGTRLGRDFPSFVDRWTQIGCPGDDFAHFAPLLGRSGNAGELDVGGQNAESFQKVAGNGQGFPVRMRGG